MTATVREIRAERYPLNPRVLEVASVERITPRMVRVRLSGDDIAGLRSDGFDDHVKLWFPDPESGEHVMPVVEDDRCLNFQDPRAVFRDYTIRRLDHGEGVLTVDFVAHEHGVGGRWAMAARPGDRLGVLGPRGTEVLPADFDYYVLLADETALPAAARCLEELPADRPALAFLEVADEAEEQPLEAGPRARVAWLHRGDAEPGTTDLLERALRDLELPPGDGFVWAGGEALTLKPVRRALKERGFVRGRTCVVDGYWRRGVVNLDHHEEDED
ncbi:siderophore-interacting protein [Actinorugispora endophytica]|uniref:NADPH-dependent ferric siderophore reductase n=1 Tax=Actinorugispora endophytica TaxID=1605990 RepID=A0A4R6V2M7_9ACTN|nr:siderophore-interacting protein [Actinorugispora endophytica]TDQ54290.1 NADPH-dependent ferric siderophore reductase [Actinorugispora endophytica]